MSGALGCRKRSVNDQSISMLCRTTKRYDGYYGDTYSLLYQEGPMNLFVIIYVLL